MTKDGTYHSVAQDGSVVLRREVTVSQDRSRTDTHVRKLLLLLLLVLLLLLLLFLLLLLLLLLRRSRIVFRRPAEWWQ